MIKQTSLFGDTVSDIVSKRDYDEICCKKCPLKKAERFSPPEMIKDAKVIFVGEAPGETEVEQGKPFVGKTGTVLRSIIDRLGVEYSITNVCKCRPMAERGLNRAPTASEMKCCAPMLQEEVRNYDLIVLVGQTALTAFFPEARIGDVVGAVITRKGKKYLTVYHPSYIVRNEQEKDEWIRDLGRVIDLVSGENGGIKKKIVGRDVSLEDALKDLNSNTIIYLDIEASSLDRFDFKMYCIGLLGDNGEIPYVFEPHQEFFPYLNTLLQGKTVVIHNSLYDIGMIGQVGIDLKNTVVKDTMFMAYLLDEVHKGSYGQKQLGRHKLGHKYWNLIVDWKDLDLEEVYTYNAEDLVVLKKLYHYFDERLSTRMKWLCENVMSGAFKAVSEIEDFGMAIDLDNLGIFKVKVQRAMAVLLDELNLIKEINWNSPVQVGDVLIELGIKDVRRTKTGRISMDKEAILYMMERHPKSKIYDLLAKLQKYNEFETLLNTFLEGTFAQVGKGGRVRSSYSFVNTVTGRLSSSRPNLQNIPRDSRIRELFVPEKGFIFVEGDCSQIELRVAAVLARDETMIRAFNDGKDLHRLTAASVMGKDESEVTKEERQKAKAVNFGFLYGQGWMSFKGFAKSQYGVELTDQEAQDWRERFFNQYRGLARWHGEVENAVRANGFIESPTGRMRRLFDDMQSGQKGVVEHAIRQAINSPVQGLASDITMMITGGIYDLRNKCSNKANARLVETVHDEFMLEVRKELEEEAKRWIAESIASVEEKLEWFDVPIVVDLKILEKWQ